MLELAQHPNYRRQFLDRICELRLKQINLERDIKGGRLDLKAALGQVLRDISWLEGLLP
jgi:hypothetical protein